MAMASFLNSGVEDIVVNFNLAKPTVSIVELVAVIMISCFPGGRPVAIICAFPSKENCFPL